MSDPLDLNDMGNGDLLLWYGNDDNKNSQEDALAEEADRQSPVLSPSDSLTGRHVDWDSQSYEWSSQQLDSDDSTAKFWSEFLGEEMPSRVASTCDTPPRPLSLMSSSCEPASGTSPVSTIYTPSSLEAMDETVAKTEPLIPEEVGHAPTDILSDAVAASEIEGGARVFIALPPTTPNVPSAPRVTAQRVKHPRGDHDIANNSMIPVMRRYGFTDESLFDISLGKLKRTVRSTDLKRLSGYRRTIMNRSYARKSRGVKQNASLSMEQELKLAQDKIAELEADLAVKDVRIRQLEFQNEFLAACGSGTHEIASTKRQ